jgi:hypothetical protein
VCRAVTYQARRLQPAQARLAPQGPRAHRGQLALLGHRDQRALQASSQGPRALLGRLARRVLRVTLAQLVLQAHRGFRAPKVTQARRARRVFRGPRVCLGLALSWLGMGHPLPLSAWMGPCIWIMAAAKCGALKLLAPGLVPLSGRY